MKCYGDAHKNPFNDGPCAVCMPNWGWTQSPRPDAERAGLLKTRPNPCEQGEWISVYVSEPAGIRGDKYATVCEYHGTMICSRTKGDAIAAMDAPGDWCPECHASNTAMQPNLLRDATQIG